MCRSVEKVAESHSQGPLNQYRGEGIPINARSRPSSRRFAIAIRFPCPTRRQMPLTANKPNAAAPTLFRLRSGKKKGALSFRLSLRRPTKVESKTISQAPRELFLRIDQGEGQSLPSPKSNSPNAGITSAEKRPPRSTKRPRRVAAADNEQNQTTTSDDWFSDHAGNLIEQLGHWSIKLDERESSLDLREQELNRRQRVLRQSQSIDGV